MEDLNKHQLILIVLLITFVTSIATGIITFTLLSEAPVEVTQQINRVVEKTIERVVPAEGQPEKSVITTTVVVNEEDRILDSISKNEKSIVRLETVGADGTEIISGIGMVVDNTGTIVADLRSYNTTSSYSIIFYDGQVYPTGKVYVDHDNGLVFLKIAIPKIDSTNYKFYPATFGDSDNLKIGQTLVAISGKDSNSASIGRIYQLKFTEDKKTVLDIISDVPFIKGTPGSPVISLSGAVVGIEAPFAEGDIKYSYIPINIVKTATSAALAELSK